MWLKSLICLKYLITLWMQSLQLIIPTKQIVVWVVLIVLVCICINGKKPENWNCIKRVEEWWNESKQTKMCITGLGYK